jgi:hypothetical protein
MWVAQHILAIIAIITIGLTWSSAHAQTAPYAVKWSYDDLVEVKRLDFIVMTDQLEIHSIVVNKGNCPIATTTNGAVELSVNDCRWSAYLVRLCRSMCQILATSYLLKS